MDELALVILGVALAALGWAVVQRFWSFTAQAPEDYSDQGPAIDIREHLNGPILCEGVIYGPTGRVTARFVADMDAQWTGDTGVMSEVFHYDGGTVQHREWRLTLLPDGSIRAEADDLVGTGTGRQAGPGVLLRYRLRLPGASVGHVLDVTDWMYLIENGTIMNRSQFRKFGIPVAELVATMRRKPHAEATRQAA